MDTQKLLQVIRESKVFGTSTCSTIAECWTDEELMEELEEMKKRQMKPTAIIDAFVDAEQAFWKREGIYDWEKSHKAAIKELKQEAKGV